ncbi:MAG TPA: UDP-N-acetylmuramoyl-tripeptide--D-alanyl-D-alanine ligase [Flavobacteriaceae bacterium]|nr:UDP-N-acetylmuramoyl-tripeptide--D-alanyl-D-alanine ligase [Flavobacteriaceae bacterium]
MTTAKLHQAFLNSDSLSTDTRTMLPGAIFFALSGENYNANLFVEKAFDKGASYVVMDDAKLYDKTNKRMLFVKNTLKALQDLAAYHRQYLGLPIIALTGSNGKTTTKNLINKVLSKKFVVQATEGNLNNHIGVPLTLLSMTEDHDLGIVEMGANHPGEIDLLCHIAQPNFGYITNFGKAHLEGFGSLEGVVQAKTELYRYLASKGGYVFVNKNDAKQLELSENQNRILFGPSELDGEDVQLLTAQPKLKFRYKSEAISTNLVGAYNFINCAAAIVIGEYFGVSKGDIVKAISVYTPDNNRSELVKTDRNLLLLDAYNANPTSVRAAIKSFIADASHSNKVLILGDMLELGSFAVKEHQDIVDLLAAHTTMKVYLVGENFNNAKNFASHITIYKTRGEIEKVLREEPLNASYILLKGSRGIALENLVKYL